MKIATQPPDSGFYLLEPLIILALIGILVATSSLTFGRITVAPSLRSEGAKVAEILRSAVLRAKATTLIQRVSLFPDSIVEQHNDREGIKEVKTNLANGVILAFPSTRKILQFSPNGTTSGVSLSLTRDRQRCLVILSLRGRVVLSC